MVRAWGFMPLELGSDVAAAEAVCEVCKVVDCDVGVVLVEAVADADAAELDAARAEARLAASDITPASPRELWPRTSTAFSSTRAAEMPLYSIFRLYEM